MLSGLSWRRLVGDLKVPGELVNDAGSRVKEKFAGLSGERVIGDANTNFYGLTKSSWSASSPGGLTIIYGYP
jgi:hypothetical protein